MSDKLRQIIAAQSQDENPFFKDAEGRIIEITASQGEVFTGYYQADNDTYYTEKDWLEQQRQKELARLAEEEYQEQQKLLAAEREKRERKRQQLAAQQNAEEAATQQHDNPKIKNLIITITVIGVIAAGILFWPASPDINENATPDVIITDTINSDTDTQRFGDAIVTGSDVRMRAEPNLQGKIVTYFPEEGERVELLKAATDSLNWAQVRRENGTTGWVFGDFIKEQ